MAVPKVEMTDIVDICHLVLILSGSRYKWWRFCGFLKEKTHLLSNALKMAQLLLIVTMMI